MICTKRHYLRQALYLTKKVLAAGTEYQCRQEGNRKYGDRAHDLHGPCHQPGHHRFHQGHQHDAWRYRSSAWRYLLCSLRAPWWMLSSGIHEKTKCSRRSMSKTTQPGGTRLIRCWRAIISWRILQPSSWLLESEEVLRPAFEATQKVSGKIFCAGSNIVSWLRCCSGFRSWHAQESEESWFLTSWST